MLIGPLRRLGPKRHQEPEHFECNKDVVEFLYTIKRHAPEDVDIPPEFINTLFLYDVPDNPSHNFATYSACHTYTTYIDFFANLADGVTMVSDLVSSFSKTNKTKLDNLRHVVPKAKKYRPLEVLGIINDVNDAAERLMNYCKTTKI